jgi:MarR family transcriptional regulator, organic hydroperoxide resistance regulator
MEIEISVFPLDNSHGYIIHRLDMQMSLGLQHAFKAKGFNITPEQWGVLNRLWENEGIHQSALAEKTSKDRHNITRILNLLEKNGFIFRTPDGEDKRRLNVYLTKEGKALKQKLIPIVIGCLKKCFEGLTQKEVQGMRRIHGHILKNLS